MNSSISSSDQRGQKAAGSAWRRFFRLAVGTAVAVGCFVYVFVVTVDPWDILPLSPALHRVPVSTNARFAFPALARNPAFDSAVFGTSTARLLRPLALDPVFGASFANLAMNSATAYEQSRMMEVFARNHPHAKFVMVGIDIVWCGTGDSYEKLTPRAFPEWMYEPNRWAAYREMFTPYAVQEAGSQFAMLIGMKKARYGRDGYTNFLPDEGLYDFERVRPKLPPIEIAQPGQPSKLDRAALKFPTHAFLQTALDRLPATTQKIVFFVPYYRGIQPAAGSDAAASVDECKARIAGMVRFVPNLHVVDFMIPSPITDEATNYWDPLHFRTPIAERLIGDLAAAAKGLPSASGDYRLLLD